MVLNMTKIETLESSDIIDMILRKRWPRTKRIDQELAQYVQRILDDVVKRGDEALADLAMRFDGVKLSPRRIAVTREEIEEARMSVGDEQISAIESAKHRLESFSEELLARLDFEIEYQGTKIRSCTRPIERVGCYVPGGQASYPSTVIMTAVPAKTAGVERLVVCSPPSDSGEISPLTLAAADVCGVDEVYRIGGAQAIAAMAYGTETVRPVQKIVGPGNKYVTTAKMLVARDMPIDLPAGPSEIVIIADESADPRIIALDMMSQLEHGTDTVAMLVTPSRDLAEAVSRECSLSAGPQCTTDSTNQTITNNRLVILSKNMNDAVDFVNEFAPEHLEILAKDALAISEKITCTGLILIGPYTPVSASDYCLGTDHVLPTGGYAHAFSAYQFSIS